MIPFDPANLFPHLPAGSYTHAEAQTHAARVDEWLGLRTRAIELELMERGCRARASGGKEMQELWIGLAIEDLMTPYVEIRSLLEELGPRPGTTIVDLGAAYGRMGFVLARHFPQVGFVGYEYVGERVREAERAMRRHAGPLARMEHADLSAPGAEIATADWYFIYDFGTPKAIDKVLHDLRRIAGRRPITVMARGRRCHELISTRHTWLIRANPLGGEARTTVFKSLPLRSRLASPFPAPESDPPPSAA